MYYHKLDTTSKVKFHERVELFIDKKSITGRQNFTITQEVRVTLAAAAVQLTLGLETWDLDYFNQILIYPCEYKNPQTGQMHKGETNMGGFMCFSWNDFLKGNQTPDDKINLGLHEFGHALRFNGINGNATDYFFDNYFKRWLACASREYTKMRKGYPSILRKYGAVNINEFFSVVIETFFEKPNEFKNTLPELFHHTSILLNQTINTNGSVVLNCRDELMSLNKGKNITAIDNAIKYVLPKSGIMYSAFLFVAFGVFSLLGDGYKYPHPYILLCIAALLWLYLERNYASIYFKDKSIRVEKGYLLHNKFYAKIVPISQLISFYVNYSNSESNLTNRQVINSSVITFYYEGNFYEEELHFELSEPDFEQLCNLLIENYVHVHVVRE